MVVTCSFAVLLLSSFIAAGHGAAFASDSAIILSEIELNPPDNGLAWVELYNAGASAVSLGNASLLLTGKDNVQNHFDLDPALVMTPDSYHVVHLTRAFFVDGWVELKLTRGEDVLSEVSGIIDPFADDHTWQRFPNAASNGIFEDWTFKKGTMGRNNGNLGQMIAECYVDPLCLNLDMVAHKTHPLRVNGSSFVVTTFSTLTVERLDLVEEEKKISARVLGRGDGPAFTYITFPKILLSGELSIYVDGTDTNLYRRDNETHSRIMLEYQSGDRTIDVVGTSVIPEFSVYAIPVASGIMALFILYWRFSKFSIQRI